MRVGLSTATLPAELSGRLAPLAEAAVLWEHLETRAAWKHRSVAMCGSPAGWPGRPGAPAVDCRPPPRALAPRTLKELTQG